MQKKQEEYAVKKILFKDFNEKIDSEEASEVRNTLNNFIKTKLSEIKPQNISYLRYKRACGCRFKLEQGLHV